MQLEIEVWLRGNDFATTDVVDLPIPAAEAWTDGDVRTLLGELLRSIDRAKNPDAAPDRPVSLRGFNWIVMPFESGGYTVAVEIQLGASATGPFQVEQAGLEQMITRVVGAERGGSAPRPSVH
jgi:hypothetical protein